LAHLNPPSDKAGTPPDPPPLHQLADSLINRLNCQNFLDIRPLLDEHWTGIPVVAASLARALIPIFGKDLRFFTTQDEVQPSAVHEALERSTGFFLEYEYHHGNARLGPIRRAPGKRSIGLYPSAKSSRRVFDYECSIIHDVSTLITPQFHMPENISHHMDFLVDDLASNALTACTSHATARDLMDYLGVPPDRLVVAYNGVSWRPHDVQIARAEIDPDSMEPFFLILGTREPRKNIALVIELLVMFPDLLASHRFVFTGKIGWLQEQFTMPPGLLDAVKSGRILFTGFLPDAEKCKLIMAAEATIFPSLFEGFGLPIIESLSVGTPCIASCSSSIPEVGGEFCTYFDPYAVLDLHRAIMAFKRERPSRDQAFRDACVASVARFTWSNTAISILRALEKRINEYERQPQ
jgi:glycosyltransferase involved in cell wall biosynthesis